MVTFNVQCFGQHVLLLLLCSFPLIYPNLFMMQIITLTFVFIRVKPGVFLKSKTMLQLVFVKKLNKCIETYAASDE